MPELLKEYPTAVVVLVVFCLVGHIPVKLALRPEPGSRLSVFLRVWEAVSLDVLKIIRTRAKDSAALKIIELIESAAPKDELLISPEQPKKCNGCGEPLLAENAWMTDGCPCNAPRGVNSKALLPPPPDSTTKPITLEPPTPEPPKGGQP